ncbi:MAG: hypothetical protein IT318_13765 [Anaerolineales bacterium]|nr:hypothetical protein [Anaerolineales bacterium]
MPFELATVLFLTPALHYGVGGFDGIRSYAADRGPDAFRLQEHAERLVDSARALGFRKLPYTADEGFVCGTAAEWGGRREIDVRTIGAGKAGLLQRALQQAFHAVLHGRHPRSVERLEYVGTASPASLLVRAHAAA